MNVKPAVSSADKQFLAAVAGGDVDAAWAYLQHGANVNSMRQNENALTIAVNNEDSAMASLLLRHGVDWKILDERGDSPLLKATKQGNRELVEALLEGGVNPNWPPVCAESEMDHYSSTGRRGYMALHQAAVDGNVDIAKTLLRADADTHMHSRMTARPLYFSAVKNKPAVAAVLLGAGADPNGGAELSDVPQDAPVYYQTSVMFALTSERSLDVLRLCLDANASQDVRNSKGQTLDEVLAAKPESKAVAELHQHYRNMPKLDDVALASLTKDSLFATNNHGLCLLDSPSTWRRFAEVRTALEERGEPLTLEDLQKTNHEGKSWMWRGAECFAADAVAETYMLAGGNLRDALLDDKNRPTEFLQTVQERQQLPKLMQAHLWRESGLKRHDLMDVVHAVGDEGRADIRNLNQLMVTTPVAAQQGVGR